MKRLHYPLEVMLTCVRRYVAYPLSLRHLEEIQMKCPDGSATSAAEQFYSLAA
ncbi:hypothetical protein CNE_BB1p07310 (plasmid) [Cupriavidus necator N-1]|uniref:Uncharacterized protein n=1 Tax=Cupriavidus necator (strain ATCC 43291 / DSM 13513 / CCUG 52238 / LMG 8453 / N-1) TaxID=1042878 RepID=F8GXS8_CUPNN|nr:hypothetical protein CNE_BB1p07310 [Cupriavidus necator N-1]